MSGKHLSSRLHPVAQEHGEETGQARKPSRRTGRRILVAFSVLFLICALILGLIWFLRPSSEEALEWQPPRSVLSAVEVSGRVGATPTLKLSQPLQIVSTKHQILSQGDGRAITAGTPVLLSVTVFDSTTGEILSPNGRPRLIVGRADDDSLGADMAHEVNGRAEGSRLLVARPLPSVSDSTASPTPTARSTKGEIVVIDILPTLASGQASAQASGSGPLEVTMRDEGPIIKHGDQLPTGPTTQPLLTGAGAQVRSDDDIVVQYFVSGWTDGIERQSTWRTGVPERVRLSELMPGLRPLLIDQKVGSRLAITLPPDQATGDDTLCIVIDILATTPTS